MKKIKVLISIVLVFSMACSSLLLSLSNAAQDKSIVYTAIGDSIASGVGASDSTKTSYVSLFRSFLSNRFHNVTLSNVAKSGDTSSDLLKKLTYNDPSVQNSEAIAVQTAVAKANIITVCIGANNVLGPMQVFKDTGKTDGFALGIQQFANDWLLIMTAIRTLNPKAQVLVMNVYNPFFSNDVLNGINIHQFSDSALSSLNGIISNQSAMKNFNYKLVDIYSAFKNYKGNEALTYIHTEKTDPHPTDAGHFLIYNEHRKAFLNSIPTNNLKNTLSSGSEMSKVQYLENGRYKLIYQEDVNIVWYYDSTSISGTDEIRSFLTNSSENKINFRYSQHTCKNAR